MHISVVFDFTVLSCPSPIRHWLIVTRHGRSPVVTVVVGGQVLFHFAMPPVSWNSSTAVERERGEVKGERKGERD